MITVTDTTSLPIEQVVNITVSNLTEKSNMKRTNDRCEMCKKILGLCDVTCKCGKTFCLKHRHSFNHNCTYDYKLEGRKEIEEKNPRIVADKITRMEDV